MATQSDQGPQRALVLGATGMLGHKIVERLSTSRMVIGTTRGGEGVRGRRLDGVELLTGVCAENLASIERALDQARPSVVINCIGVIKQLPEAQDPVTSIEVNALFPHKLARLISDREMRLIHFSTDCVFSGAKGNYTEDDVADPIDLYGRSKHLGEVRGKGCLTLRSSIIGHELRGHVGLIDWFLSQKGKMIKGYAHAIYSGVTTIAMAELIERVLDDWITLEGIWHVSSAPITKYELLSAVNEIYDLGVTIERDESFYCDRSLNSARFRRQTGWEPRPWETMIQELHKDYLLHAI